MSHMWVPIDYTHRMRQGPSVRREEGGGRRRREEEGLSVRNWTIYYCSYYYHPTVLLHSLPG